MEGSSRAILLPPHPHLRREEGLRATRREKVQAWEDDDSLDVTAWEHDQRLWPLPEDSRR